MKNYPKLTKNQLTIPPTQVILILSSFICYRKDYISMENKVTLTAHRGWRAKYPENTMLGFRKALELDIDGVEMDVHMTKDYHIVVCLPA